MTQKDQDLLKMSLKPELYTHVSAYVEKRHAGDQSEAFAQAVTNLQNIADEWENETESPDLEDVRRLRDFTDEIKFWSDFEDLSHFHIDFEEVFDIPHLTVEQHQTLCLIAVQDIVKHLKEGNVAEALSIAELAALEDVPLHAALDYLYDDYADGKLDADEIKRPFVECLLNIIG